MKIAVLLFGHMRTFEVCSPHLHQHLLKKYDCDIFIHTWDTNDSNRFDNEQPLTYIDKIMTCYAPIGIKVEKQDFFEDMGEYSKDTHSPLKTYSVPLNGLKYMLYSMYQANLLRVQHQKTDTRVQYDYIIFLRPDVKLNRDFIIDDYFNEFTFNPNTVISFCNYPAFTITNNKMQNIYKASDLFFLMSQQSANTLFSDFNFFNHYYITFPSLFPKFSFHPELSFHEFIIGNSLVHRYYLNSFTVVRDNYKNNINILPINNDKYTNIKIKSNEKYKKYFKISIFFILILITFNIYLLLMH